MARHLISSVRLFDGDSVSHESAYVEIAEGIIIGITDERPADLRGDLTEISGAGCTLLPGLIDGHVHVYNQARECLGQSLAYGVTTVIDLHNEAPWAEEAKRLARERNDVADILSSFNSATIPRGWPRNVFLSLDSSDEETGEGFNLVPEEELLNTPSMIVQQTLVESAHRHSVLAVAHAMNHSDTHAVLQAGVDAVVHSLMDKPPTTELIAAFKDSGAFVVPTLTVTASNTGAEAESRARFADGLAGLQKENLCACTRYARTSQSIQAGYDQVRALQAAGVDIVCGTDASPGFAGMHIGLSLHHELWLYVHRCGMSPMEALKTTTSVSARRWRLLDRGQIAVGKKADLVLVRGDPTKDIGVTTNIVGVWRNGDRMLHPQYAPLTA
ncbi:hypothetical protein PG993_014149 [Apiospora rasikravindrae]|uniref:Amidohydrolase-related domain-containing protein n=1 Tax=Apiospora rasikravindrae TaxID=990691 RepID=A0ABR1RU95_9PEZI